MYLLGKEGTQRDWRPKVGLGHKKRFTCPCFPRWPTQRTWYLSEASSLTGWALSTPGEARCPHFHPENGPSLAPRKSGPASGASGGPAPEPPLSRESLLPAEKETLSTPAEMPALRPPPQAQPLRSEQDGISALEEKEPWSRSTHAQERGLWAHGANGPRGWQRLPREEVWGKGRRRRGDQQDWTAKSACGLCPFQQAKVLFLPRKQETRPSSYFRNKHLLHLCQRGCLQQDPRPLALRWGTGL